MIPNFNQVFMLCVIICVFSVFNCDGGAVQRISRKKCQEYGNLIKSKTCVESSGNEGRAKFEEYPHMAMIGYNDTHTNMKWSCSGVLISDQYILTNAHCVHDKNPSVIRLGDLNIESDEDNMHVQDIKISEVKEHPQYTGGALYNDIALIKLEKPVEFNEYILPACLPDGNEQIDIANQKFIKSGWGLLPRPTQKPYVLFNKNIPGVSYKTCKEEYTQVSGLKNGLDENTHICTGTTEHACQIISGSPIQLKDNDVKCMYKIFGLLSFALSKSTSECALDKSEVSTKVSAYIDWIERNVWL